MDLINIFALLIGFVIGSFLNVCIYRLPKGLSIISPGSRCPKCNTPIKWYQNIPIISFIILKGRCGECGEKISWQYPIVEVITGIISYALMKQWGPSPGYLVYFIFFSGLLVATIVDARHGIIPDEVSIGGMILGLILSFINPRIGVKDSLLGVFIGGGILYLVAWAYYLITKREGMGGGDIKLLAMIGSFLGVIGSIFGLMCGAFIGAIIGGIFMLFRGKDLKYAISFGPFLAIGATIYYLWGKEIIMWYIKFMRWISGSI